MSSSSSSPPSSAPCRNYCTHFFNVVRMQYHATFVTEAGMHPKTSTMLHHLMEQEYRGVHVPNTPVAHLTFPKAASRFTRGTRSV